MGESKRLINQAIFKLQENTLLDWHEIIKNTHCQCWVLTHYQLLSLNIQTSNPQQSRLATGIRYHWADTLWLMLTAIVLDLFSARSRSRSWSLRALPQGELEQAWAFCSLLFFPLSLLISFKFLIPVPKRKMVITFSPNIAHHILGTRTCFGFTRPLSCWFSRIIFIFFTMYPFSIKDKRKKNMALKSCLF